jgi:hypothetical protein
MSEFEKIYLENKADEFILKNFWAARSIENELKDFYLSSNRKVWTMLPGGLDVKIVTGFPWSYKNGDTSLSFDYEQILLDILNSDTKLEWIALDNVSETSEDPQKLSAEVENLTTVFFYKETVFHWLPKNLVNKENIEKAVNIGFYPTFGIVTSLNDSIKENILNNNVISDDIEIIIHNIKYIAMGAYDEEGCLFIEINN